MGGMLLLWWATASGAWALDLDEARARAESRALAVERAEAAADVARGDATAAVEAALPSVQGFAGVSTGAGQTSFGFQRPIATQIGLGARLSWTALDPSTWARATQARREAEGKRAMVDWARVDARAAATSVYARTLGAQAEVDALGEMLTHATHTEEVVGSKVDVGLVPAVDGLRAQAETATTRARLAEARGRLAASCAELQALLGDPVDGACRLDAVAWDAPRPVTGDHPALVAFAAVLDASAAGRRAAGWALGPVVDVDGTVAHYIVPGTSSGLGWSVGAELTVPIVPGDGRWGGLGIARGLARDAEVALEEQRRALSVAEVAAARRHAAAVEALTAREAALTAARQALDAADEEYGVGRSSVVDLLSARAAWGEALLARAAAVTEVGEALAALEAARGVRG